MVLSFHKDFNFSTNMCGAIDLEMKTFSSSTPLGDGKPIVAPMEGGKNLMVGNPAGWKNALAGTNVARDSMEDPKIHIVLMGQ